MKLTPPISLDITLQLGFTSHGKLREWNRFYQMVFFVWRERNSIISSLARVHGTIFIKPVEEAVEDGYAVCIKAVVVGPNGVITVAGTPIVGVVDVVTASVLATVVGAIVGDGGLLWAGVVAVTEDGTNVVLAVIVVEVLNNIAGTVDVFSKMKMPVMSFNSFSLKPIWIWKK